MIPGIKPIEETITKIFLNFKISENVSFTYSQQDNADFQCNNLVKHSKHPQIEDIKKELIKRISELDEISSVDISKSGFVNINLSNKYFENFISFNLNFLDIEHEKILIDYGGPNIGKALHVGHLRTLNIGRSIYNTNKFVGNEITSDIHFGDWGMPIALIISYLREKNIDINTISPLDLETIYPNASSLSLENEGFYEKAKIISHKLNKKESKYIDDWRIIYDLSVNEIKILLEKLNHNFDYFYGESSVVSEVNQLIEEIKSLDLVRIDNGALVSNEDCDPPIIIVKSDGSYLYLTTDLGTVVFREKNFNVDKYIYVVDLRQANHFRQLFSTVKYFNLSNKVFEHVEYGTVNDKDKKPLKTRDGGVYKLEDLYTSIYQELEKNNSNTNTNLDTLTNSVLTYSDLLPNRKINYEFDVKKFTDINGKTAIYLQYAYVRAKKLLENIENIQDINFDNLNNYERELSLEISKFTSVITVAISKSEPHHLANYGFTLSQAFNSFYTNNKIFDSNTSEADKQKRLKLVHEFKTTILNVFYCLGLVPVDEM